MPEARHFKEYLVSLQEYNSRKLRVADQSVALHRAQGALMVVETIQSIPEMIRESLDREVEKKKRETVVNRNVFMKP